MNSFIGLQLPLIRVQEPEMSVEQAGKGDSTHQHAHGLGNGGMPDWAGIQHPLVLMRHRMGMKSFSPGIGTAGHMKTRSGSRPD